MGAAAPFIMGGAALVSAYGAIKSANMQADALEEQARLKRISAMEAVKQSERDAELTIKRGKDIASGNTSAFGRSGVDLGSGTPLLMIANNLVKSRDEAKNILEQGQFRAGMMDAEAGSNEYIANQTRTAGRISAFGSILSGGGQIAKGLG